MAAELIAGRYLLCDPIASGGSGTVWRAYDQQRQRYCAAKLLRQRDAGELLRFAREQSVRLDHPHIVSPYAWAADDGMVLIASELLNGGSLQVLLGDYGALAEETVVEILEQVLSALQAVHTAELIHRDVKPGNLLLRATGNGPLQVMLADFGLTISRRDARLTATGMVIGTPGYLPPEVLLGRVSPEPAHDMYAVGKLALALLTGREIAAIDQDDVVIADPSLRDVVRSLLCADPDGRPASALAARMMLQDAARSATPRTSDGEPITVLDQLPPLPAGWGEAGEVVATSRTPRATLVESAGSAPLGLPAEPSAEQATAPTRNGTAAPPPDLRRVQGQERPDSAAPTAPIQRPAGSSAGIGNPLPVAGNPPPAERRKRWSWQAVVGAVTGLLLVVVVSVIVVRSMDTEPGDGTGTPGSSVSTPSTTGSTPPTTEPATESVPPATETAPPATETAPVTTAAGVRAGDACSWQVEGDRTNTADGQLVCTVDAGVYRWVVAPG